MGNNQNRPAQDAAAKAAAEREAAENRESAEDREEAADRPQDAARVMDEHSVNTNPALSGPGTDAGGVHDTQRQQASKEKGKAKARLDHEVPLGDVVEPGETGSLTPASRPAAKDAVMSYADDTLKKAKD